MHFFIGHPISICDLQDASQASLLERNKASDGFGCQLTRFTSVDSHWNDNGIEQPYLGLTAANICAPLWLETLQDFPNKLDNVVVHVAIC